MVEDFSAWTDKARNFATLGGYTLHDDVNRMRFGVEHVVTALKGVLATDDTRECQNSLRRLLAEIKPIALAAIDAVPIELEPRLLEERTPFSAYMAINDLVRAAKVRLHYFDRYLNVDFFPLYLRNLDRSVQVWLVTTKGDATYGVTNMLAAAKLAKAEFADFRLIECDYKDLHDRHVRIDDKVVNLGQSPKVKTYGPICLSPGDSTTAGHIKLDDIAKGTQVVL
jgi:hypothetical protein